MYRTNHLPDFRRYLLAPNTHHSSRGSIWVNAPVRFLFPFRKGLARGAANVGRAGATRGEAGPAIILGVRWSRGAVAYARNRNVR